MVYFGENDNFLFAECENCKRELRISKEQIKENNAFFCQLSMPAKCDCEKLDDTVRKDRQSTYGIRHQIASLLDLLHKKNVVETKIDEINAELNYRKKPPAYFNIITKDIIFSLKLFFILLGVGIGLELLVFIICGVVFFTGFAIQSQDICILGNTLLYNLNILLTKYGGNVMKSFNFPVEYPPLDLNKTSAAFNSAASDTFIIDYLPYAVAGILRLVFVIGIIALIVRLGITLIRIIYYVTVVLSKKYQINQGREEHEATLATLSSRLQDFNDKISQYDIIPSDFRGLKEVETIYSYFVNNRVDTVRDALNIYQSENLMHKLIEYQRVIYGELKLTKKYTKAMYILTSDERAQVEVKEDTEDLESYKMKAIFMSAVGGIKNRRKPIKKVSGSSKNTISGSTSYYDKRKIPSEKNTNRLPEKSEASDKDIKR